MWCSASVVLQFSRIAIRRAFLEMTAGVPLISIRRTPTTTSRMAELMRDRSLEIELILSDGPRPETPVVWIAVHLYLECRKRVGVVSSRLSKRACLTKAQSRTIDRSPMQGVLLSVRTPVRLLGARAGWKVRIVALVLLEIEVEGGA